MIGIPDDLRQRLRQHDQEHVLTWWDALMDGERRELLDQLRHIDLAQIRRLYDNRDHAVPLPSRARIQPVHVIRPGQPDTADGLTLTEAKELGEQALRHGQVAALVVAGGQGSRLGFEHPKGMYPIGPISQKSLFEMHAEKIRALAKRYGQPMPFLIMTSPTNDAETKAFFAKHRYFGLSPHDVHFFSQGTMPAVDLQTGRLLMERRARIFTSPNGHGGTLTALADSGLLKQVQAAGIRHIFYFQVDNPLVRIADPAFLGYHVAARAEVSTKIVPKRSPDDKVGNLVLVDGRQAMIEYSDLPADMANECDQQGQLRFWVGSPAIHIFDADFLERVTSADARLAFHVARKKVPYLDLSGHMAEPTAPNALKFEMFVFDVLPQAERWAVVETSRREEFEPLKNATGLDSPETVHQAISDLAADWLRQAGVTVPTRPDGHAAVMLEISPLFALDADELAAKVLPELRIEGPTYFGP